jgi:hypothetical protein
MTYQHTIDAIDLELSNLDARRALLLESRATLARLVGESPAIPVRSRQPEKPRQSATHAAESIGASDVDDVEELPPASAKAAPAPILCLACDQPFKRAGNRQKVCGACRDLYPTLSLEEIVRRRASGALRPAIAAGVLDAEGFATLPCAGPGARNVEPCPDRETVRKKGNARGPLRCAECLAEERRRSAKSSYNRRKKREAGDGEASRHDLRTTESLADDAHGDREPGTRGGRDGHARGTEPASAPADAGGPGADRVVEASGRGAVDDREATTGPALEGDEDEEGDREGEPEDEPPALLREHDIQEDLSAPPRRAPGRPAKNRDPRYRRVNERAETERAAREATDSTTTAGSWWTRPKSREEFSGTAMKRFEETRHSKAAARVKTPSSPAI